MQVSYAAGSSIAVDGHVFHLKQFHFHAPSENRVNGASFPMEAHLVHADKDGNLAVVAILFRQGEANEALAEAWAKMPRRNGDRYAFPSRIDAAGLLPADRAYYRFNGSLTTPPCTEGVLWLVMKNPVPASQTAVRKVHRHDRATQQPPDSAAQCARRVAVEPTPFSCRQKPLS